MEVLTSSSTYFSISEPKAKLMTRFSREMTLINSDSSDLTKKKVRVLFVFLLFFVSRRNFVCYLNDCPISIITHGNSSVWPRAKLKRFLITFEGKKGGEEISANAHNVFTALSSSHLH